MKSEGGRDLGKSVNSHLQQWSSNFPLRQSQWRACGNPDAGPTSSVSVSFILGWDLRVCICNKFLGDGATAGPRTPPREAHIVMGSKTRCMGMSGQRWKRESVEIIFRVPQFSQ